MTTLLALASPELCAAALRQPPPTSPEDAVRVICDGATAMRLDVVCAPWDHEAEAAGVRAKLGASSADTSDWLAWAATVAGWLVATPDDRPVIGVVSGPLWLSATVRREHPRLDPQDALDEASDFVAARVRTLCELGVAQVVVLERAGDDAAEPGAAAEAHTAIARLGRHFGVPATLVALDDAVPAGDLGYGRWVSPSRGAAGLALVATASLRDGAARSRDHVECVVTEYLRADVTPGAVRDVAGTVTSTGRRS
jgi:hypothetical protein